MGRLADRTKDLWRRQALTRPRLDRLVRFESQQEVPCSIPRDTVVVVGTERTPKWAIFECPCGTGHRIMVTLLDNQARHWRLETSTDRLSLYPSVNFHDAQGRCHFWLQDGHVDFTRDSVRPRRRRRVAKGAT
jgi:hypothetical protein